MKSKSFINALIIWVLLFCAVATPATAAWDAQGDVLRLGKEAPSLAAFPGAECIVWLSSHNYSMRPDGRPEKRHRLLILLAERDEGGPLAFDLPYPFAAGPSAEITEAMWLEPSSGEKIAALETDMAADGTKVIIPPGARSGIIAIETRFADDKKRYLDDVITLAGPVPAWEQRVEVEVPEGMDCYWQGTGVSRPERSVSLGLERIVWTVMNQPAWQTGGLLDEYPPALVFSLRKGLASSLRDFRNLENSFAAPRVPTGISANGGPQKAVDGIAAYMADRIIRPDETSLPSVRDRYLIGETGPWTPWEGTLIAGKWLESMGFNVRVFWSQKLPVGALGPDAIAIWREPLLIVKDGARDVYFVAGRTEKFGKLPPSLCGASVYRFDGADVQRVVLPSGSASDHTLTQQWRLSIGTDGVASGSLDITATGGWANILSHGEKPGPRDAMAIADQMSFFLPAINLEPISVQPVANGYRATFGVRAPLGIVAGGDILMRMPGSLPLSLSDIPTNGEGFSLRFPFVFEQNVIVSTPEGYRSFGLPGKTRNGDSRAVMDESIAHWEKSSRIEASSKWTVRSATIDAALAGRIIDQLAMARKWTETTVPLRK
ncbi:MAG: hypothetical protein LBS45_10295 [Synergistaceae bacterium]|nr:hypothetical protein [Synergistaceae bacterium]